MSTQRLVDTAVLVVFALVLLVVGTIADAYGWCAGLARTVVKGDK